MGVTTRDREREEADVSTSLVLQLPNMQARQVARWKRGSGEVKGLGWGSRWWSAGLAGKKWSV